MKALIAYVIASLALVGGYALSAAPVAFAAHLILAQSEGATQERPKVNPRIDNPNNPAVPGHEKTDPKPVPSDNAIRSLEPGDSAGDGRSRCATLTDTLARRRCLEELQRSLNNN